MNTFIATMTAEPGRVAITSIGWDTENTGREKTNLLRLRMHIDNSKRRD